MNEQKVQEQEHDGFRVGETQFVDILDFELPQELRERGVWLNGELAVTGVRNNMIALATPEPAPSRRRQEEPRLYQAWAFDDGVLPEPEPSGGWLAPKPEPRVLSRVTLEEAVRVLENNGDYGPRPALVPDYMLGTIRAEFAAHTVASYSANAAVPVEVLDVVRQVYAQAALHSVQGAWRSDPLVEVGRLGRGVQGAWGSRMLAVLSGYGL